jgi:hypothetical protein
MESQSTLDDESFKFRALSAGAVMAFDGQTELLSPVELDTHSSERIYRTTCSLFSWR